MNQRLVIHRASPEDRFAGEEVAPRPSGTVPNPKLTKAEAAILAQARRRNLDRPVAPLRRPTLPGDDIYQQALPLRSIANADIPHLISYASAFRDRLQGEGKQLPPMTDNVLNALHWARRKDEDFPFSEADEAVFRAIDQEMTEVHPEMFNQGERFNNIPRIFGWQGYETSPPIPEPAKGNVLYQSLPPEAQAQVDAVVETINRHAAPAAAAPPPPPPPPPPDAPPSVPGGNRPAGSRLLAAIDSPTGWEVLAGALASGLFVAPSLIASNEDPKEEALKLALAMGGGIGGGLAAGRLGRRVGNHFRPNDSHYGTAAEIGGHMIGDGAGVLLGTALGGALADTFGWDPRLPQP